MENKMTNLMALNIVLDTCELADDVKEKITNIRNSYQKKADYKPKDNKPSASVIANAKIKEDILASMEVDKEYLVTEIMELVPSIKADATITSNKISQLLYQLRKEEKVNRVEKKRKAYYSLVVETAEMVAE